MRCPQRLASCVLWYDAARMEVSVSAQYFGWSKQVQERAVLAALIAYVLGYLAFAPNALLVADEALYVGQAAAFADGTKSHEVRYVLQKTGRREVVSTYPAGTSLLQAPFVKLGGWRGAFLPSLLALIGTVVVLLKWLRTIERPPIFALLPLICIGTSVQGRLAMSDEITAFLTALALWLYARGERGDQRSWLAAGFFAGLTALFRDATPLLFVPVFGMALVRRARCAWQLILGSGIGVSIRLVIAKLMFGSALFVRESAQGQVPLSLRAVVDNIPLYLVILTVAIPLGLPSLLLHRSKANLALALGSLALVGLYLTFPLPHEANGLVRDLVLHSRYCNALVPIIAVTMAEWIPRLTERRSVLRRVIVVGAVASAFALSTTVHLYLHHWGQTVERMAAEIYSLTPEDSVFLTNPQSTDKFMSDVYGHRDIIYRPDVTPDTVADYVARGNTIYAVFVDRTETLYRREDARHNHEFMSALSTRCNIDMLIDRQESAVERLWIGRIAHCEVMKLK